MSRAKYDLVDAIISPRAAAIDVSQWYSNINHLYFSKISRLKCRKKWIDYAIALKRKNFTGKLSRAQNDVSKYVFCNATKLLWRSFTRKIIFQSRIFNLHFYYAQLHRVVYERRNNIRIQWKSYARALMYGLSPPGTDYRDLWISFAFLLKKRQIIEAARNFRKAPKISFAGKNQTREIWRKYSRAILCNYRIQQTRTKARADRVLSNFFQHALIPYRVQKTAENVISVHFDYSIVNPMVKQSCDEVTHFAKLWLRKKAQNFSIAYADETFKTSFVHIMSKVRSQAQSP
ncbi:hypothetical protein TRFO_02126 [Tritrichomonas foetus]|uniref:Uncharacterized protein n=1 Tax=Tritrichomonas foetus TaxID=1144522 RepID=A0A1J4J7K5_9EUKA|nr:hypothetical protein TRFO_02126 [Tritrichomonas foetus]|eukprot:OHS95194.1 hypothetical protein TRFO_02126 [Tritrichomonas foetus]